MTKNTAADFTESLRSPLQHSHQELRSSALNYLEKSDFPTTRQEDWKYTRLQRLQKERFAINRNDEKLDVSGFRADPDAILLVFVNGFFRNDLSDPDWKNTGVSMLSENGSLQPATKRNVFSAINEACFTDGIQLEVKEELKKTIELLFLGTGKNTASIIRNSIKANKNAKASFIFNYRSLNDDVTLLNSVTTAEVAENADLTIDLVQAENASFHFNLVEVDQKKDSRFSINTISLNGSLIRNDLNIRSNGENTETHLNGLYLLKGDQHVDNHTVMDHRFAHCNSNELYKGIMDGKSTGVFNGKVFVRPDAQKINAFQSNANVLLSDDAQINTKPELEIYADDVKCSHGSTTGQMDEEALFYLRARGIGEENARRLLVKAFAEDVIEKIPNKNLQEYIEGIMDARFHFSE